MPKTPAPRYNAIQLILEFSHACMRERNQALLEYVQKNRKSVLAEGVNQVAFDTQVHALEQNLNEAQKGLTETSLERGNQLYFDALDALTGTCLSSLRDQHKSSPAIFPISKNNLLTDLFLESIFARVRPSFSGKESARDEEYETYRRLFTQWVRACAVNSDIIQPFGRLDIIGDEFGIKYTPNPDEEQRREEMFEKSRPSPIDKAKAFKLGGN